MNKLHIATTDQCILHLKHNDYRLAKVIDIIGPIEYYVLQDSFEFLVNQIISQMLSNKVAKILQKRLKDKCGGKISPKHVLDLSKEDIRSIGISHSKANYILNLTKVALKEEIRFSELESLNDDEVIQELRTVKGIGFWTAKMYLLFLMNRPDVLPIEDSAFQQAYRWLYDTNEISSKSILENCAPWKPYSSVASRYLYRALDSGLTSTNIESFLS